MLSEKIIRYFLSTSSIDGINFYAVGIKIYFYFYLIFYLEKKYINILKNVLFIEKLAISWEIKLSGSMIIWKKSLLIIILIIRSIQIMNKTYNTKLPIIKVLIIIKV